MLLNKITLILSMASILVCVAGMVLANREAVSPNVGGLLFVLGGLLGLFALVCTVLVLVITKAYPVAMIGVFGLVPLLAVVSGVTGAFQHPRINDITTDVANPPVFTHAGQLAPNADRDMAFPKGNAEIIPGAYPRLAPLGMNLSPDQGYARALEVAKARKDWEITHEDPAGRVFEGVATTKLFRWRDDFVVRVTPTPEGTSRVDMRSKSREGESDLGANARRIEMYLDDLKEHDVAKAQ